MTIEYSGYLGVSDLDPAKRERLEALAAEAGLGLELYEAALEFEYQGRDTGRKVVRFLSELAAILNSAEGEIRCELGDDGESRYEFYSIENGRLYRQTAEIVRQTKVEVPR